MINKLHAEMIKLYAGDPKRIQHFCKVHSYAKLIAELENVDEKTRFILETAALTHDIGIHICEQKYGDCGGKLQEQDVSTRVQYLIAHHHTYEDMDGIDYQILVEADFLVNMYEDTLSQQAVQHAYTTIFRTETGKMICRDMFALT